MCPLSIAFNDKMWLKIHHMPKLNVCDVRLVGIFSQRKLINVLDASHVLKKPQKLHSTDIKLLTR